VSFGPVEILIYFFIGAERKNFTRILQSKLPQM